MSLPHDPHEELGSSVAPDIPTTLGLDRGDLVRYYQKKGEEILSDPNIARQIIEAIRMALKDQSIWILLVLCMFFLSGCTLSELGEIDRMIKRTEIENKIAAVRSKQIPTPPDIRALKEVPETEPSS